jgi:hypothetical protein
MNFLVLFNYNQSRDFTSKVPDSMGWIMEKELLVVLG